MRTVSEAHATVLDFFGAPKEDYTVVFTSNATGALKLVGEAFPFTKGSSYVLGTDSHNSVCTSSKRMQRNSCIRAG